MWAQVGGVVFVLALVVLVVLPVFDNGFVYDDVDIIERGDVIHDPSNLWTMFRHHTLFVTPDHAGEELLVDTYRPITLVSFVWDAAISGREPWAYHLTNLLMHLTCILLVFLFVKELLGEDLWPFALAAAAWFGLTPHPSSAHIWINGRSDLFCTAFGLAALLVWRRGLRGTGGAERALGLALSAALFLAGLLSKETLLFALPAVVLWPEPSAHFGLVTRLRRAGALVAAGLGYLGLRAAVLGGLRAHEGGDHLWQTVTFVAPLEIEGLLGALGPRRLHLRFLTEELGRLSSLELAAYACVFGALAAGAWLLRRRLPLVAWGGFWFVCTLAPAAIIAGMLWPGFGRYLYLPSVGLAVALGSAAAGLYDALPRWRPLLTATGALYLAVLAFHLRGWVKDFRDQETLYTAAIEKNPEGAHGYGWLAMAYLADGRDEDAIGPLVVAHRLAPDEVRYPKELLKAFVRTERADAAIRLAEECAPRYERDATAFHMTLLNAKHMTDPDAASFQVLECLRKEPSSPDCAAALEKLVTAHPKRTEYRAIVQEKLQDERLAAVRRQTEPLMQSLR